MMIGAWLALLALMPESAPAQIHVGKVEAWWEDTLAVIRPEILEPFSEPTRLTLQSGLPVAVDIEVRLFRTGYAKTIRRRIEVQYNVWQDRYRVITPIGPLAVKDYPTVLTLFRRDLILTLPRRELPGDSPWFLKVRVGERRVLGKGDDDRLSAMERELSGLVGWLFRRGRAKESYTDWSRLAELPKYRKGEGR
ncbi:MAG TPA: hypothetical protein ENI92_03360 [Bacteroidetes bacterium]|nr:hypothetical protein [Bacteroidota bacterium]